VATTLAMALAEPVGLTPTFPLVAGVGGG